MAKGCQRLGDDIAQQRMLPGCQEEDVVSAKSPEDQTVEQAKGASPRLKERHPSVSPGYRQVTLISLSAFL